LVTAGGALASTVLRSMLFHAGASGPRVTAGLDTRAAALLVGCVVGLVVAWGMVPTGRRFRQAMQVASVVSLAWLAFLFCSSRYGSVELGHNPGRAFDEAYLAVSVAAGLLVLALVTTPWRPVVRLLSVPPIAWVGRISYGLYLWHFPVDLLLTADRVGFGGWPLQLARIGLTFAIAVASWTFVERPCLRLKRRFETERTADERVPLTPVAAA
jgi:peptidoglycan/LPS O-acetylase OafA/YrhL